MTQIMDLMKIRIHYYQDMINHVYFFVDPDYDCELSQKLYKKLKHTDDVKIQVLTDLKKKLQKIEDD